MEDKTSPPADLREAVVASLRKRQCILLLGQRYLDDPDGDNRLFRAFEAVTGKPDPYVWWLNDDHDLAAREEALRPVDRAVGAPEIIASYLRLPWRAVFTSAIDGTLRRLLESPGRRSVASVMSPQFGALASGGDITVGRLFGSVERPDPGEAPPRDLADLRRRRADATAMLLRVRELLSPRGSILIEGWDPDQDWLRPRDLAPALQDFVPGQVIAFGIGEEAEGRLRDDDDFAALLESGIVAISRRSLSTVVSELFETGDLTAELFATGDEPDVRYDILRTQPHSTAAPPSSDDLVHVRFSRSEWRRITSGLVQLIDLDPSKPLPESEEARYQLFRSFAAAGPQDSNLPWLRQLAFRRPVLDAVVEKCRWLCDQSDPEEYLIVLYGQSGSGKTVLVHQLALELRRLGLPVILYSQSLAPISRENIDIFCEAVSKRSNAPVFLLYDGTSQDIEYVNLAAYLASRGRKSIVVGTCYPGQYESAEAPADAAPSRRSSRHRGRVIDIQIPIELAPEERAALLKHIGSFVPGAESQFSPLLGHDLSNFFAAIYRLLPETRPGLEAGIIAEITTGSERIQRRLKELTDTESAGPPGMTEMERKLRAALGNRIDELVGETLLVQAKDGTQYPVHTAMTLLHAIMLSTAVNVHVPQGLALRLIHHNIPVYRAATDGDIIREVPIGGDAWALSGRHPLEAEIWLSHRLPLTSDRVRVLRKLVLCLSGQEAYRAWSPELECSVKLLQAYGPEGDYRHRLPAHYFNLAEIVGELRRRYPSVHPRFLLVQSHLIREAVRRAQNHMSPGGEDSAHQLEDWLRRLDDAGQGLDVAIDVVKAESEGRPRFAARRMLATLATERACVLGVKLGSLNRRLSREELSLSGAQGRANAYFDDARRSWREALGYDDSNIHAIDAACWISQERFRAGFGDAAAEAEVLAEWSEAIDRYLEMDLSPTQMDKRDEREARFSQALGNVQRFDAVVDRMAERGSTAVHSLLARDIAARDGDRAAIGYLDDHCSDFLLTDRHLLVLYMRLWWRAETALDGYLPHERLCIAFSLAQWSRLRELTAARLACSGEEEHPTSRFLSACAMVHLGDAPAAARLLDDLDRSGVGGFRRSRSLVLATDEYGSPRRYSAEYQGRRRASRYLAWCDELRTNVFFMPNDFRLTDPQPGTNLGEFHLSIQFRGLLAEPTFRYRAENGVSRHRGS